MKRLIILLLLSLVAFNLLASQTVNVGSGINAFRVLSSDDNETRIEFGVGSFDKRAVQIDGKEFFHLLLKGEGISQDKGNPELPVFNRSIIIPNTARMNIEVYDIQFTDLLLPIAPSKGVITRDINPASVPYTFANVYDENLFFPSNIASLSEPYIMKDFRGITIQTTPFAYNPISRTLRVYHSYKIRVFNSGTDTVNTLLSSRSSISRAFLPIYENHFINFNTHRYTPVSDTFGKLLVISHANYLTQIAPYVNWKKQKGIETELVSFSTIGTTAAQLQTYIQNRYNADNSITYIQLVGDAPQIPTLTSGGGGSDPSFALVAGSDYYPDIFIGRFSAETTAQVSTQVNKSISYERDRTTADTWLSRATGIASSEGGGSQGDNGESDIQHMNIIRTKLLNYGYTTVDQIYDPGALASIVTTNVNAGRGFMNYVGHGSDTSWVTTGFNNTNATNLTNAHMTPVIMDVACVNGNFVSLTCFAEAWLRNANGGAVTMYASTINQSWNSPMRAQDEFTDLLTTESKFTAGGLYYNSSCKMMDIYGNTNGSDGVNMYRTWTIFGDASLLVRSKTPTLMTVTHPSSIIVGTSTVNVSTGTPNALVALTHNNSIYTRGYTNSSGNVSLTLNSAPQTAFDYTITATAFNKVTYIGTIQQVPGNGPFMTVSATNYVDANNNVPEYNEAGGFNISFTNIGTATATNVSATLSTSTTGITITDNSESIASIEAAATITRNNAFTFNIANNVVNGTVATFTITMVSGTETWVHEFNITLNAPSLSFGNMSILDPSGNNNGRLDPGETVTIQIPLQNLGGAASISGTALLSSSTNGITINGNTFGFSPIAAGGSTNISFSVTASADMVVGTNASFVFAATAGAYVANKNETIAVGLIIEDFESGSFASFPWVMGGSLPWTVVNQGAYAGTYSAKSGAITHSQSTTLEITRVLSTSGQLSFWYKVSSEASYDYLKFYIDGVLQNSPGWAGTIGWTQATYTLAAGTRVLKWEYMKDNIVSSGSDCAWLDNIIFPASTSPSVYNPPQNLVATGQNQLVSLTWQAPVSGTPTGYKIFKNGALLTTTTALSYNDSAVVNGSTYTYYLRATYTGGESDPTATVSATPSNSSEVVIGTGTSTQSYPIDRYYNYSTHEAIYLASEIVNSGQITKLAYNKSSGTDINPINAVSIYMKQTTDSALSTGNYSTTGYTLVYSGAFTNTATSGWMEVTLNTPFTYSNSSNLAVLVVKGYQAYITTYPSYRYTTQSPTRARQNRSDSSQPTSLTASTYLPNLRLTLVPTTSYNPPQNPSATASYQIVNLSWQAPVSGTPTGYKIFRNSSLLTTVTTLSYSDLAVNNGSTYSYYITAQYSGGESDPSTTVQATPNAIAPTNLTAEAGNGLVSLSWTAASGRNSSISLAKAGTDPTRLISGYRIYRNGIALTDLTLTTYQDTDVVNGSQYSYYVSTLYTNPSGESSPSNTATATPTADTPTPVVIGIGTTPTPTTEGAPINIWYKSLHGQSIYTAAELNALGIVGARTITHFGFNIVSSPNLPLPNFQVRMKHSTSANSSVWNDDTNLITVYSNASYMPSIRGWDMLPLSIPFEWNGVDNLLIDTAFDMVADYSQSGSIEYTSVPSGYIYNRSDTQNQASNFTGGTTTSYRPNVRLLLAPLSADPALLVNPTSHSFGSVNLGTSVNRIITLTNSGGGNLTIQSISLQGSAAYTLSNLPSLPLVLSGGANISFNAVFNPNSIGNHNATITITDDRASTNIALSGIGYSPYPIEPRFIAEFETAKGALIRYPVGLPYTLIRELASNDLLYVIVSSANQSAAISAFTSNSVNMTNVRWVVANSDSYWTRDYGPWFIFDSSGEMKIVDFNYNRPRPNDNAIPVAIANHLGIPYYTMNITHTGGNIMSDGNGMAASTTLVQTENSSLTTAQINQRMNDYLGVSDYQLYQDPNGDYIQHIDCFAKLLDVDKVIIRSVPSSHSQYSQIEAVVASFASKTSSWGTPYRIYRVYTPNNEPYSNAFILNKKILVPQMGTANDAAALQVYRQAMPGYQVIGFTGTWESTDAIHCRINFIPDADLIHINHTPISNVASNQNTTLDLNIQHTNALDFNQSHVAWKHSAISPWQFANINVQGTRSYSSTIPTPEYGDTLFYMVKVKDITGKERTHPLCGTLDPFIRVSTTVGNLSTPVLSIIDQSGSIRLSWNTIPGAQNYRILRADTPNGTYTQIGFTNHNQLTINNNTRNRSGFYKVVATTQTQ